MKCAILLLVAHYVASYNHDYKGFSNCGIGGWSCHNHMHGIYEIVYQCSATSDRNARLWVWTARIPSMSSILTIKNCKSVELHMDCTRGTRGHQLRELRIVNVTSLEFLAPLRPGVFLHDNDQVPQSPPVIHIENVENVTFLPKQFEKAGGQCKNQSIELQEFSIINSTIPRIPTAVFQNQTLKRFSLIQVNISNIQEKSISITGRTTVLNCNFDTIPSNGLTFNGFQDITFGENSFKKIESTGLTIKSRNVSFYGNEFQEVQGNAFNILALHVFLISNKWNYINAKAFESIYPGFTPGEYEIASKFKYQFSNNIIGNMEPGSLHVAWDSYKQVCSEITLTNNIFNCTCSNVGWLGMENRLGPNIANFKEFYDVLLKQNSSFCQRAEDCYSFINEKIVKDICSNATLNQICFKTVADSSNVKNQSVPVIQSERDDWEVDLEEQNIIDGNESQIFASYYENSTGSKIGTAWLVIIIVTVTAALIVVAALAAYRYWYKKRRTLVTGYAYSNREYKGMDDVVLVSEHQNILYEKEQSENNCN